MSRGSREAGLSAGELIVSMAMLVLLSLFLTRIYGVSLNAFQAGSRRVLLARRARLALEAVAPLLAGAVPSRPGQPALYVPAIGKWAHRAVISTGVVGPRNSISYVRRVIDFDLRTGRVTLRHGDASRVLARHLRRLEFHRLDRGCVRVRVVVSAASGRDVVSLQRTVEIPSLEPGL